MGLFTPGANEIRVATLIPRGRALGLVNIIPNEEASMTKQEMLAHIKTCMGGRAAEELIFGPENVGAGAASDFEAATDMAYKMVTQWGKLDCGCNNNPRTL